MKPFLPFLLLLLSIGVTAQVTISLNPNPITIEVNPVDFETVAHAMVKNESNETKEFTWQRTEIELSSTWTSAVCDKNTCYADFVSEQCFTLEAGEEGLMDVHIRPFNTTGSALVEIRVFEKNNPDNFVVGTYNFTEMTTSVSDVERLGLKLYPNPTANYFQLTENDVVDEVVVYNILGKQMQSFSGNNTNYDISNLPSGMYLVGLLAGNENIKTLRLRKL